MVNLSRNLKINYLDSGIGFQLHIIGSLLHAIDNSLADMI